MNAFFKSILDGINSVLGNYGWSMMVFTLIIRLIILPFDYKSRSSMRKTTKLQPEITRLQKKYANDKNKLNQKISELYKKEHVNPMSSCLPMLLSMPILFIMFAAMRSVAYEQMAKQTLTMLTGQPAVMEGWLWIKNLWMADNPFNTCMPDVNSLRIIGADVWQNALRAFSPEQIEAMNATLASGGSTLVISAETVLDTFSAGNMQNTAQQLLLGLGTLDFYREAVTPLNGLGNINFLFWNLSICNGWNGLLLLPILSAVSQFVMTAIQPQQPGQDAQQQSTSSFMKWFFPIFSFLICLNYTAAFALYWVTSNLLALIQTPIINHLLDQKDAKEAAAEVEGTVK